MTIYTAAKLKSEALGHGCSGQSLGIIFSEPFAGGSECPLFCDNEEDIDEWIKNKGMDAVNYFVVSIELNSESWSCRPSAQMLENNLPQKKDLPSPVPNWSWGAYTSSRNL